ncbi:MAG: hypothetical protein MUD05_04245 [Candidatus Nanopelagicales bacterium]|nr:hypothetical protein [Candidatus Nanopelagicales bacterium]
MDDILERIEVGLERERPAARQGAAGPPEAGELVARGLRGVRPTRRDEDQRVAGLPFHDLHGRRGGGHVCVAQVAEPFCLTTGQDELAVGEVHRLQGAVAGEVAQGHVGGALRGHTLRRACQEVVVLLGRDVGVELPGSGRAVDPIFLRRRGQLGGGDVMAAFARRHDE